MGEFLLQCQEYYFDTCKLLSDKRDFQIKAVRAGGTEGAATYPELREAKTTKDPGDVDC